MKKIDYNKMCEIIDKVGGLVIGVLVVILMFAAAPVVEYVMTLV